MESKEEQDMSEQIGQIFFEEWKKKLEESKIFDKNDQDWIVNRENAPQIIKTLGLELLITQQEASLLLDFYEKNEAKWEQFQKDLIKVTENISESDYTQIVNAYKTPAERIVKTLIVIKEQYLKDDPSTEREINFAINNINERKIYATGANMDPVVPTLKQKNSQIIEWLNEYSDVNHESNSSSSLKKLHLSKQSSSSSDSSYLTPVGKNPQQIKDLRRKSTIRTLLQEYEQFEEKMQDASLRTFDLFQFNQIVGRDKTLQLLFIHLCMQHHLDVYINERKVAMFLDDIYRAYRRDVQYHNDLHGIDVAQMAHLFLVQGKLIQLAELDHIDVLSFLTSAVCHDLGHDGYTNGYHVNACTDRAIRYNDVSVQESYHVAEAFAIIRRDETNFLEQLTVDEFKVFRKRMIGCILATDMAKHAGDLSALKTLVDTKQIKNGQNAGAIINKENETTTFKSQQFILECCLHACDVSQQTRTFKVVKEWTYLLFEEFFHQGDLEKDQGLPISFLCNRETTNIAKSQPGFINGITLPLWITLTEIMPQMQEYVDQAKENAVAWDKYEETEEDKKVY